VRRGWPSSYQIPHYENRNRSDQNKKRSYPDSNRQKAKRSKVVH